MAYDAKKMREKLKTRMAGRQADPNEFKPPKCSGEEIKLKFYVMPPVSEGDTTVNGLASRTMDFYYVKTGVHWVDKKPHTCPRAATEDEERCELCQAGFDMIKELKNKGMNQNGDEFKNQKKAIVDDFLARENQLVNVYFPRLKVNPEELQGRVMWFKAPMAVAIHMEQCLNRDDSGDDPESPQAFGAFFDEHAAFSYEMKINKQGEYNDYKAGGFLGVGPRPMIIKADGTADEKAIKAIMDARHDLYTKIEPYDTAMMTRITKRMLDGDDEDGGGFDSDETKSAGKAPAKPAARQDKPKAEEKPKPARRAIDEDEEDDYVAPVKPRKPAEVLEEDEEAPVKPKAAAKSSKKPDPIEEDDEPAAVAVAAKGPDDESDSGDDDDDIDDLMASLDE